MATLVETGDICIATPKGGGGEWGGGSGEEGSQQRFIQGGPAQGPTPYPQELFLDFLTPIK